MTRVRLADLLVALSGVTDMGMSQPLASAANACYLSTSLARAMSLPEPVVQDVFYTSLLEHIGCTAYSHESAAYFADEQSIKEVSNETNFADLRDVFFGYLPGVTAKAPAGERFKTFRSALIYGNRITDGYTHASCEVGTSMARRLGLSEGVQAGLLHVFEWWNGKGRPRHLKGDDLAIAIRVAHVGAYAALFFRLDGTDGAVNAIRRRSGGYLDPVIAEAFCRNAPALLGELGSADVLAALPGIEPTPWLQIAEDRLDEVLRAFGDVVDLKAPYFHGHAARTADLASKAAETMGMSAGEDNAVRRASFVHDLGRAGVPNGIWERPGSLRSEEWAQVRLHSYHSEQVIERSEALRAVAPIAGAHHERLDGSGYYRKATAATLPMTARLLAVASAFCAMTQDRPHRKAMHLQAASRELRAGAKDGTLDHDAVDAVLTAAGEAPARARREWPAGLTERQVDVLRLVARGLSNRDVAAQLQVSVRTAEHHIQDVYGKIGSSSRAAAALFAMEHRLLERKDW